MTISITESWYKEKRKLCRSMAPKWMCKICYNKKCKKENMEYMIDNNKFKSEVPRRVE